MEIKVNRLLQPTGFTKDHDPTDLATFERGMFTFLPSDVCLLRDFVYPLVRGEPNLFPHPFVHLLCDQNELPVDINKMKWKFQCTDQFQYYFVMPEGPTIDTENAIWSKIGAEFHIRELGYSYGVATLYKNVEKYTPWHMVVYCVDPQRVLKCGSVELGLHQVELRWKAVRIIPRSACFHRFYTAPPSASPPPPLALSGMYAFVPSDICLLRDFVYPLVRNEPNLFPHPFVHQLHDRSELPVYMDEMRKRFQILDHHFCDMYYFVMLEGPPTGEKNAIEIGGTKVFWRQRENWIVYSCDTGPSFGYATKYIYMHGECDIGWCMVIYRINPFKVRTCGPVELGLNQIESRWVAIKIYQRKEPMLVFNPVPLLVLAPSDESPPPPPPSPPPASTGNKRNRHHPPASSSNKRNRYLPPA